MTNWASYIRKRPITRSSASASPKRTVTPAARSTVTNWASYIRKRPITRSLASASPGRTVTPAARRTVTPAARRTVTPVVRPLSTSSVRPLSTTSVRPTYAIPPPTLTRPTPGAVLTNGGLGFDLGGITGQLQGTGQEIVDRIQSFLPTAFKILLVFIGIKILFWFLGRRR
jgi:hypothetical protein